MKTADFYKSLNAEKVLIFQERFNKEGANMVVEFMDFLTDWLVDHLETEDQKYVKCFHDHGLF
jgi:hemerythrin